MAVLQSLIMEYCWVANLFSLALIAGTRLLMNTKLAWAGVGCVLLVVAIMNALLVGATDLSPTNTGASLLASSSSDLLGRVLSEIGLLMVLPNNPLVRDAGSIAPLRLIQWRRRQTG